MKKLLLPFEGGHYPQELLNFVAALQPVAPVLLTAAFVPESDYASVAGLRDLPQSAPFCCYGDEDRMVRYNRKQLEQLTGSFGRSVFSETFSASFSTELIRQHRVPVFIAHK
jgi:hypothetical protein